MSSAMQRRTLRFPHARNLLKRWQSLMRMLWKRGVVLVAPLVSRLSCCETQFARLHSVEPWFLCCAAPRSKTMESKHFFVLSYVALPQRGLTHYCKLLSQRSLLVSVLLTSVSHGVLACFSSVTWFFFFFFVNIFQDYLSSKPARARFDSRHFNWWHFSDSLSSFGR
mmetsp:Transcript_7747/g.16576  ORF Transcript_7747/g.16576 Transcript_7747/m.16576 type:complete len:167 (+) Transcript_7747:275-775(+)